MVTIQHTLSFQQDWLLRTIKMTLEEAIQHCEDVANENCGECANDHIQLALWLRELKERREAIK